MPALDIGQRSESVRRANLSTIVRELHLNGPLSRSELVTRTSLTRSSIRGHVGELVTAGLATEMAPARLRLPGRPSPIVRLVPGAAVALALEIAVDSLAAALVGLGGVVFDIVRVDRPRGHSSVDEVVADLVSLAESVRSMRPAGERVIGTGVAMAGVVRHSDGLVSVAPNLGWRDVPLGDRLTLALGSSNPIAVANEADLGALAELRRGAAIGSDNLVFVSGEVGVGGGVIADGRPLMGLAGYGGEIGHLPINPAGAACRCGAIGCWETEVGEEALLVRAGHAREGGRSDVEAVIREASDGSVVALTALDEVGRWLGVGLAGLVNVFNPALIVLGGRFARLYPFVIRTLEAELDRRALQAPRDLVRVVPATLGQDASLLGAAELAFEPLLADPAAWLAPRDPVEHVVSASVS